MSRSDRDRRLPRTMLLGAATLTLLALLQGTGWAGIMSGVADRSGRVRREAGDVVDTTRTAVEDAAEPVEEAVQDTISSITDTVDTAEEEAVDTVRDAVSDGAAVVERARDAAPATGPVARATRPVTRSLRPAEALPGREGADAQPKSVAAPRSRAAMSATSTGAASSSFLRKPKIRGQAIGQNPADGDLPVLVSLGNLLTGDRVLGSRLNQQDGQEGSGRLAFTGAGVSGLVAAGLLLSAVGSSLALLARRRSRPAAVAVA